MDKTTASDKHIRIDLDEFVCGRLYLSITEVDGGSERLRAKEKWFVDMESGDFSGPDFSELAFVCGTPDFLTEVLCELAGLGERGSVRISRLAAPAFV